MSFIEELPDKANNSVFNLDDTEEKKATDDHQGDEASNEQDDEVEVGTSATDKHRFSVIVNSILCRQRSTVNNSHEELPHKAFFPRGGIFRSK